MSIFYMPSLGADMEGAVLVEWLVEPGSQVKRGDVIAVVETDKGAIEIEVFETGTLTRYLVELGADVLVGAPLAEINGTDAGKTVTSELPAAATPIAPDHPSAPPAKSAAVSTTAVAASVEPTRAVRASPAARRLAADRGIDLSPLTGSGPDGAIVLADVEQAANSTAHAAAPAVRGPGIDLAAMRQAIASAMARSKREIPHYYLKHTIDLNAATVWLRDFNAQCAPGERLLPGALYLKASALALVKHPEFNGFYDQDTYQPSAKIHVGTAIAIRGGGLVAPALHNVNETPLPELMAQLRDLVARVRAGRFRASELSDPTVTVSSLGDRGVEELYGVIYPPQVACIGFGKVVGRPWSLADGTIATRPLLTITLSADHRASDGHSGAALLSAIEQALSAPENL